MGRRKERRLAAKIGAGRRVKLDLFAEPSGDLGGSSAKDEVGTDVDAKPDPGLPNSPSSSGQQLENPLSLLGQYSDDELDDGSNETAGATDDDKQAQESVREPSEEGEVGGIEDLSTQKADNQELEREAATASASHVVEADPVISNMVNLDGKHHEVDIENQDPVPLASDNQTPGGMGSTWKMVFHEESNRYYYWNTVTGETSWEVPDSLVPGAAFTNELGILGTEMKECASDDTNAPTAFGVKLDDFSARHGIGYTSVVPDMKAAYEQGTLVNQSNEQCIVDGNQLLGSSSVIGALPYETSTFGNYSLSEHLNTGGASSAAVGYEGHSHITMINEQVAVDLPLNLVKRSEALLERLKLLEGSGVESEQHGWLSKCILEIEIRLSDIRSLLPYGSSLLPYWLHSERQLNQLENTVNTEIGKHNTKVSGMHSDPTEGKEANVEHTGQEAEVDANIGKLPPENSRGIVPDTDAVVQKIHDEDLSKELNGIATHEEASPKPEFQSGEDVDMDIDMEVEDSSPARNRTVDIGDQLVASSEQFVQLSAPVAGQSLAPETEFIVPPPPEEEWIPPPPPDNEGIPPPPPPDEPPESLCPPPPPPSGPEPVQSVFSEQYIMPFPESSANYYGNTSIGSLGSIYEHADGSQIAAVTLPGYYATVSNTQPIVMPMSADSAGYYGLQNGALPVVPVATTIVTPLFQAASNHLNSDLPQQVAPVDPLAGSSSLSNQFTDPLAPGAKTNIPSSQVSSTSLVSAPPAVSTKEYVSASSSAAATSVTAASISTAVSDTSVAVSKPQSKASKMKKTKVSVASTLRSNKKVSSLVDKWKAAKEELQEEQEEERETPLEILEKKRQREIEEWRAQQIASGEAKENANFQPLGGDWRERVKRRRAQKEAAVKTPSNAANDDETKQVDLNKFSRDLPPGWQAYWDDSSKQIYYGNSITSETSWTRPTK